MQIDVVQLRDFYASPLGQVVARIVATRIRSRWRNVSGGTLVGLGYATPYLGTFRKSAGRVGALMPMGQGALIWPKSGPKACALVDEERLPLPDNCVDFLLVVHGFEMAGRVRPVLREMWRVLAPQGRLLMVVPNRRGVWARTDRTPFGFGRPYSRRQLDAMLTQAMFTPINWGAALYVPPFSRDTLLRTAVAWERAGAGIAPGFGGVILAEATKELIAPVGKVKKRRMITEMLPAGVRPATKAGHR